MPGTYLHAWTATRSGPIIREPRLADDYCVGAILDNLAAGIPLFRDWVPLFRDGHSTMSSGR